MKEGLVREGKGGGRRKRRRRCGWVGGWVLGGDEEVRERASFKLVDGERKKESDG